ncbi:MAG: glycosyltransferase family 1 protein [Betaproteobacteria bacterium]|nr:glycosyltransferase family 1 protein [Betaproteobacteria bacterium]
MNNRRKILFIGFNIRYLNPTSSLWVAVMRRVFNLHFFGPGYVDSKILSDGVERYLEIIGDVDFIFTNHYFCFKNKSERLNQFLNNFTATLSENIFVSQRFLDDTKLFLQKNRHRVCCFLTEVDPHVTEQSNLDECLRHAAYFIMWGEGFLNPTADFSAVAEEKYIQKKIKKGYKLGSLDNFASANRSNIINLGHMIADHEFYWGALANRKYDVSVPGSRYYRRKKIIDMIDGSSLKFNMVQPRYSIVYKFVQRLSMKPYSNFYLINLYNLLFQRVLSQSKICITDGGANNYPVRKFFEIPAAGALMLCKPAEGLGLLGFKHRTNCLFIQDIAEVIEIVQEICLNLDRYEHMARACQDLVLQNHSTTARAVQLSEAFERIYAGTFNGSSWQDGSFKCI